MASNQALIDQIVNDRTLDEASKLHLLRQVDPDFPTEPSLPQPTGPALQRDSLTPPPPTPPVKPRGSGFLGSLARGAMRAPGLVLAPGLDLSESILEKLGVLPSSETPITDAATGTRPPRESELFLQDLGRILPEPEGAGPRIAERVGEEVALGLPWLRAARTAGRLGPELGTLTAAGTGAGIAQQVAPDNVVAEVLGQLSGYGTAGALGMVKRVFPHTSPEEASAQMKGILGSQVGNLPKAREQVGEAQRLGLEFPGFQPTLGMASGDPGLLAIEAQARGKSPQIESTLQLRITKSRESLRKGLSLLEDQIPVPTGAIEQQVQTPLIQYQQMVLNAKATFDERLQGVAQRFYEREAQLNPRSREEAGHLLVKELTQAKAEAEATSDALYKQIRGTDERIVSLDPLLKQIVSLRKEVNPAELPGSDGVSLSFPQDVVSHIERLAEGGQGETTFEVLRGLRRTVGHALDLESTKVAPDRVLQGRLERLQAAVEETIDRNIGDRFTPDEIHAISTANSFYREEVIRKFRQGPVATLWRAGTHGEPTRLSPSKAVSTFFHGGAGAAEDAKALRAALGARSTDTFREAALADLYARASDTDGKLIPAAFERWITNYRDALRVYPEVWTQVSSLQKAQASLQTLGKAVEALPKAILSPEVLESETARLFLNRPADLAVKDLLKDPHPQQRLMEFDRLTKGDALAKAGLRREVWTQLVNQMGLSVPQGTLWSDHTKTVAEVIQRHRPLLESLYPLEHLDRLQRIAKGESILARVPETVNVTNLQLLEKSGVAKQVGTFWSRLFAEARGVVGVPFILTEAMTRGMVKAMEGISVEQQKAIVEHAILDPDLLRTMEGLAKGWSPKTVNQKLTDWVGRTGRRIPILGVETRQSVFYLPNDTGKP